MPANDQTLKRPGFFAQQRLTADDLNALTQYHQQMRWEHNKSLHGWGIIGGLNVYAEGESLARIEPGFAIDNQGREIILSETVTLTVPAVAHDGSGSAKTYFLTVSYPEDADLKAQLRDGSCGARGAVRYDEVPVIEWKDPNLPTYRVGLDVVIASVEIKGCKLAGPISDKVRREALPAPQPYVASGLASRNDLEWELFPSQANPLGIEATVPTNTVGFRNTPNYQAHVMGERIIRWEDEDGTEQTVILDGLTHVTHPTPLNFVIRMFLPTIRLVRVGRFVNYFMTLGDLARVFDELQRIEGVISLYPSATLVTLNGADLFVGKSVQVLVLDGLFPQVRFFTLRAEHFTATVNDIGARTGLTPERLLEVNGMGPDSVHLTLAQPLKIPTEFETDVEINPGELWENPGELTRIVNEEANWSVVWMGVEE